MKIKIIFITPTLPQLLTVMSNFIVLFCFK